MRTSLVYFLHNILISLRYYRKKLNMLPAVSGSVNLNKHHIFHTCIHRIISALYILWLGHAKPSLFYAFKINILRQGLELPNEACRQLKVQYTFCSMIIESKQILREDKRQINRTCFEI